MYFLRFKQWLNKSYIRIRWKLQCNSKSWQDMIEKKIGKKYLFIYLLGAIFTNMELSQSWILVCVSINFLIFLFRQFWNEPISGKGTCRKNRNTNPNIKKGSVWFKFEESCPWSKLVLQVRRYQGWRSHSLLCTWNTE